MGSVEAFKKNEHSSFLDRQKHLSAAISTVTQSRQRELLPLRRGIDNRAGQIEIDPTEGRARVHRLRAISARCLFN